MKTFALSLRVLNARTFSTSSNWRQKDRLWERRVSGSRPCSPWAHEIGPKLDIYSALLPSSSADLWLGCSLAQQVAFAWERARSISSGCSRENLFLTFFSSENYPQSLAHGHITLTSGYVITTLFSDSDSSAFLLWIALNLLRGWSPYLRILNLITSAKSLLPCKVTYSQVLRVGYGHFGSYYSAYHTCKH